VILIKVVELVVDKDRRIDLFFNFKLECTGGGCACADFVVLCLLNLLNLVAHDVEDDSKAQEHQAKERKNDHRASKRRDWSPCGKHLLLETTCLKLFNFLLDLLTLFLSDIHNLFK